MKRRKRVGALSAAVLISVYYFYGIRIFAAFIISIAAHEAGHIIGFLLSGGRIKDFRIEAGGFSISGTGINSNAGEILMLLAGPISGFALAGICVLTESLFLKTVSAVSLMLSVYNLMPALPLDGGRITERLLSSKYDRRKAEKILEISGIICGAVSVLTGAYFSQFVLMGGGLWLLIAQTGIVKNRRLL